MNPTAKTDQPPKVDQKKLLNTHSFHIDLTAVTGQPYSGNFVCHRPTMQEMIRIGVIEARDLGGLTNVDIQTTMLAHMISTLEVAIDSAPEWWKPRELKDAEVVQEVYEKYIDYLRQFQRKPESQSNS